MFYNNIIIMGEINITPLIKAHTTLKAGKAQAENELERDGVIQRFEYTYELVWKTLQKIIAYKGVVANSPRDVFREAARLGIIDDPIEWFDFLKARNLTTHTYNQITAQEIFDTIPLFIEKVDTIIEMIKEIK